MNMKITYKATIEIDESKFENLPKPYIKEQVKLAVDLYIASLEQDFEGINYLFSENAERSKGGKV